jgi:hypothetical protein
MVPRSGDVVVSNRCATIEYDVTVVDSAVEESHPNHSQAMMRGHQLASERQVDLWLTEDQIHFLALASYRPRGTVASPR